MNWKNGEVYVYAAIAENYCIGLADFPVALEFPRNLVQVTAAAITRNN
ncbi:MAG: hypothetical protein JST81_08480 [Bacteroidetes bacterium]|nr:hypothetical protein [Bacteroidota bacterium]